MTTRSTLATDMSEIKKPLLDDDKARDQQQEPADETETTHPLPPLFRRIAAFEIIKAVCLCGVYNALNRLLWGVGVHELVVPAVCQLLGIVGTLLWIGYGQPQGESQSLALFDWYMFGVQMALVMRYPGALNTPCYTGADSARGKAAKAVAYTGMLFTLGGVMLALCSLVIKPASYQMIMASEVVWLLAPWLLMIAGSFMLEHSGENVVCTVSAIPGRVAITVFDACCHYLRHGRKTRRTTTFSQPGAARYGQVWAADVGVWMRLAAMALPMSLVWMCGEHTLAVLVLKVPTLSDFFPMIVWVLYLVVCTSWKRIAAHPVADRWPDFVKGPLGCVRLGSLLGLVPLVMSIALALLGPSGVNTLVGDGMSLLSFLILGVACALVLLGSVWFVVREVPETLKPMVLAVFMMVAGVGHLLTCASQRALRLTCDQQFWMYTALAGAAVVYFYQAARSWTLQKSAKAIAAAATA
ncbi:hypothetical protein RI367_003241 [Sorochytrium milnesiophthora]